MEASPDEGGWRAGKAARGRRFARRSIRALRPLVRARQTAEIVAGGVAPRPSLVNIESLAPGASFAALVTDLEKHARKTRIALVGHEPGVGEIAARLIGSRHPIEFKKGAICRIDVDDVPPTPRRHCWFLPPKNLAR